MSVDDRQNKHWVSHHDGWVGTHPAVMVPENMGDRHARIMLPPAGGTQLPANTSEEVPRPGGGG